jgi:hypothetical protein
LIYFNPIKGKKKSISFKRENNWLSKDIYTNYANKITWKRAH